MEEPKLFLATAELLNKTLQYLATRPYSEVVELINGLMDVKPQEEPKKELDGE